MLCKASLSRLSPLNSASTAKTANPLPDASFAALSLPQRSLPKSQSKPILSLRSSTLNDLTSSDRAVEELKRRFDLYMTQNNDEVIPGDLRRSIFVYAVRYGGEKEWEKMLQVYRHPPTQQHKLAAMIALTSGSTPELQQRAFELLSSDEVKTQDVVRIVSLHRPQGLLLTHPVCLTRCTSSPGLQDTARPVAPFGTIRRRTLPRSSSDSWATSHVRHLY